MNVPAPGEVYWVEVGLPTRKRAIVVSQEQFNRGDYVVTVLTTTENLDTRWDLPNCVPVRAGKYGFTKNCVAQGETIAMTEKADLDLEAGPIGLLDADGMRNLIRAIGVVIGAEYEPV